MVGASFPIEERMEGEEALRGIFTTGENISGAVEWRGKGWWVLLEAGMHNPGGVTRCCSEGCVITRVGLLGKGECGVPGGCVANVAKRASGKRAIRMRS